MKTHIIWFCISVAALIVGMQFARKEVQVVEKPVEIVKTKEVPVAQPVEVVKEVPKAVERSSERNVPSPPIVTQGFAEEDAKRHQRYDPFLVRLGLTPAQMDRFVALKRAIAEAQADLQAAVEQNEVQGGTAGVEALRSKLTRPMWDEIRQMLGEDGYKAYGDYEQTSAFYPVVTGLFQASGVSIADQQTDQVARLLVRDQQTFRANPTDISLRIQIDWNAVARDAGDFLTPAQLAVIRAKAAQQSSH